MAFFDSIEGKTFVAQLIHNLKKIGSQLDKLVAEKEETPAEKLANANEKLDRLSEVLDLKKNIYAKLVAAAITAAYPDELSTEEMELLERDAYIAAKNYYREYFKEEEE